MKSSDKWEFASVKATLEDVNNGRTKLWVFGNSPPNYFLFQMGKKSSGKRKLNFIDERKRPGWAPSTSKTSACALQIRPVRLLAPAVSSFAVKPYTFVWLTPAVKRYYCPRSCHWDPVLWWRGCGVQKSCLAEAMYICSITT